ncbi:MAG: Gfo/Idh/MocA family oxidoreductase [Chloroflexota bacterium]|nr:Gfo/Idh/MocA family oxidoreductase [Chloroflexota bacterium]
MAINVGVIGVGYWGPNLLRNIFQAPSADLAVVCDSDPKRLDYISNLYRTVSRTTDYSQVLSARDVQAVVLATPAHTHYKLTKAALVAGKHVLVEKPLALTSAEAWELVELADQVNRVLMVGHTFMYNPAVRAMKELIGTGEIGDVYYIYSNRVNLGRVRQDINALWNIAPHDISILLYLLMRMPTWVAAHGAVFLQESIEDVVFVTLSFDDNVIAHVQVSWLDPSKVRQMTVVGSKKMIVYDDMAGEGKIKIYDKGALKIGNDSIYGEYQIKLHSGDIYIPKIEMTEPLRNECIHFLECIETNQQPLTDGRNGWQVVRILEAAQQSLRNNGQAVEISDEWA